MEKIFGGLLHILKIPMGGHQRIARPTTKPTLQNKINYGTQLKRITIFRHPYKKRKWPNHHRYQPQTNGHPAIQPLQKPPPPKNSIESIPYTLARGILTKSPMKTKKNTPQRTTHNLTPEKISNNTNK